MQSSVGTWSLNPMVWFDRARDGSEACALVGMLHLLALAVVLVVGLVAVSVGVS